MRKILTSITDMRLTLLRLITGTMQNNFAKGRSNVVRGPEHSGDGSGKHSGINRELSNRKNGAMHFEDARELSNGRNVIMPGADAVELSIGGVKLKSPFLLGPMAGFTDAPMRRICEEMGAGLTYTEMVSARALHYDDRKSRDLMFMYPGEHPIAIQIFGHEPEMIAEAAEKIQELPADIIDINMGCPVPKVFKNGDGSALMRDPEQAEKVVRAAVTHSSKPVTAKIRLGIDDAHINCVEVAQALEAGGASAVAVHGRTRVQYYEGTADWDMIRKVRESVSIPVIANGDVRDVESARAIMEKTGCDFVMVARAALGNPWIFKDLTNWWLGKPAENPPTLEDKKAMMKRQLTDMVDLKGEYVALREMRKVSGFYLKGLPGGAKIRGVINRIDDLQELLKMIDLLGTPELKEKVVSM